ncbi:short-chain dehydrogenase TIC 32 B, chloroplastic-like isoform X1 [Zingiber officinale]|uniref:short-chain dehydrogenase TIC 32 B, chloroplastic-like isoform X1 n=1 Tax=Zingiber officinale TaxID=94328 RepID=UPI001C4C769E|nr:short-chain dehydrogenase TIC 32 B, chloroplastic-like isoform X1 [Zingiber officinale]XP_042431602.1 short-chain dehydrogenase TIC 32 B, chloroplastic-like isoform X1 [Zingiber officinale]
MLETVKYLIGSAGTSGFGSKSTGEEVTAAAASRLRSITAIVTGATSGIGAETARVLAMRGARLVLPARNLKAAEETKTRIATEFPGAEIVVLPLDLSSFASVRCFVSRFLALRLPLNLLVNNAGKFSHDYAVSEDGVEMTFATNYLGHFLLTKLLLNKMAETARETGIQGRIVNVTSAIHTWFSGDSLHYLDLITGQKVPYDGTRVYALSKLANVLHAMELTLRLQQMEANVTANCVHPGIVRTGLTRDREGLVTDLAFFLMSKLLKTIPQAAATTCYVAAHPGLEGVSGKYYADCNEASPSTSACSREEATRMWLASEVMTARFRLEALPPSEEAEM